jgi:hypothetical protein
LIFSFFLFFPHEGGVWVLDPRLRTLESSFCEPGDHIPPLAWAVAAPDSGVDTRLER